MIAPRSSTLTSFSYFVLPGTIILWWQYYFPKPGQVWASARRRDDPVMRVLYSLGFWVVVMFLTLMLIDAFRHN